MMNTWKWTLALTGLIGLGCAAEADDELPVEDRAAVAAAPGFCGGIANIPCPSGETCIDDPTDPCDPQAGHADCGGICVPSLCGGIAGIPCPGDEICVDDPGDGCNPDKGHADCSGICVADVFCGGIAGIQCPDGQICVDDPTDLCAPPEGNDCAGLCVPDPGGCSSNAECEISEYCEFDAGTCGGSGSCEPRPMGCTNQLSPLCGCNGQTYLNGCLAAMGRQSVASDGPCN